MLECSLHYLMLEPRNFLLSLAVYLEALDEIAGDQTALEVNMGILKGCELSCRVLGCLNSFSLSYGGLVADIFLHPDPSPLHAGPP